MDDKGINWYIEEWLKLLEREEAAFQHLCSFYDDKQYVKTHEKSKATKEWWLLVNAILWMQIRTKAQLNHDLYPAPIKMLARMANIAEELSSGLVSTIISDVSGGRPLWRAERHDIAYGVAYIKAVRRGELEDRSPNKTVRQAYDVTARTVQRWMHKEQEISVGAPFKHLSPQQLKVKMLESGSRYSKLGRGAPEHN